MDPNTDQLSDEDAVDLSNDMRAELQRQEEEAKRKKEEESDDDADIDDAFDDEDGKSGGDSDDDDRDGGEDTDDDTNDSDSDDSDEADDDPDGSVTDVPKVPKKKKQSAKERIEELAEARRKAEADAFNAEMRAVEAERERDAAKASATQNPSPQNADIGQEPKADDFKYGEMDPDYVQAKIDYGIKKGVAEAVGKESKSAEQRAEEERAEGYRKKLNNIMVKGGEKHKDFEAKLTSVVFEPQLARMVIDSEHAVDIGYYLANNVSKLRELTLMDATARAKTIGRMEERFSARSSAAKKRSKAPDMPSGKRRKRQDGQEAKYGPQDQDAFDKAFNGG